MPARQFREEPRGGWGSVGVGAWSCFEIVVYATAHFTSRGPDGTEQLWKGCVSAAVSSQIWESSWNVGTGVGTAPPPGRKPKETSPKRQEMSILERQRPSRPLVQTFTLHYTPMRHRWQQQTEQSSVPNLTYRPKRKPTKLCRNNK